MKVFLSYDSADEKFAGELREGLTKFGLDVWNPNRELRRGSNWLLQTGRALERADSVVFVFSHHTEKSPWSRKEVEYAISHPKYQGKVVSVRLAPNVDMPWILETLPVVDVKQGDAGAAAKQIARTLAAVSQTV